MRGKNGNHHELSDVIYIYIRALKMLLFGGVSVTNTSYLFS
jgi:hypothetical protein